MAAALEDVLDGIGVKPLTWLVWVLCAAVIALDGYDLTVIGLMAPGLVHEFGLEKAALGFVFSAGMVGMVAGSLVGGWLGDRFGRRSCMIWSCFTFGLGTLSMIFASTIFEFGACRFVIGIGLGVAMASAVAMAAEFSPSRVRNRAMALIGTALPVGAMVPGVIAASYVAAHDWRVLVLIGGLLPIALVVLMGFFLPESVRFLALRVEHAAHLHALLWRLGFRAKWEHPESDAKSAGGSGVSVARLFDAGNSLVSASLWMVFFANGMALYVILNWLPLVLEGLGETPENAGRLVALFTGGGLVGGLVVAGLVNRLGTMIVPAMFVLAIPFVLAVSLAGLSPAGLISCLAIAGIAIGANQVSCPAIAGLLYPTQIRATGVGWGVASGRVGAILGPAAGSVIFAFELPPQQLFAIATLPLAIGAVGGVMLSVARLREHGSVRFIPTAGQV